MNAVSLGSLIAALGVILGAFGSHSLRGRIGYDLLHFYETGTQYLLTHAFAILLYGLSKARAKWPLYCFGFGILIFTGSLFIMTFGGPRTLGAVTPIGGLLFIAGWIGFALETRTKKA